MKEVIIFIIIFILIFAFTLIIFNGRFIYAQMKYYFIGPFPIVSEKGEISPLQKIVIPSIGVEAPIILLENTDEYTQQKALEQGVIYWPESASPGEKGTIIILGHSSAYPWYKGKYGSVFSLLDKLKEGDEIFLFSEKKKYTYQVIGKEIKTPKDLNIEKQEKEPTLYLISCWPINTNFKRIAVKALTLDNK